MLISNLSYNMDDDVSSVESYDSDLVDSDIEAELYSTIHHEAISTEPDTNPEQSSSINFISVDKHSNVIERDFNSNVNINMNSSKGSEGNQLIKNKNVSLKRKSNLISGILGTIQVLESKRKKRKTLNPQNKSPGSQSSTGNATIELSDSDSDSSVILSEPDESLVLKMKTNVETLCVSSDSESSVSWLDESKMSSNFNHSNNDNSNGNYADVWKIDETDLYRAKRNSARRYHENAVSQCTNCKEKGHTAKYCTEARVIKCFICGGAHIAFNCRNRICFKCLQYGHDSRRCFFPVDNLWCSICKMRGHAQKCCPDLWRRYHLTTSRGQIVRGPPYYQPTNVYCFNCGQQGHLGQFCTKSRMGRTNPHWPSVVSYDHPGDTYSEFRMNRDIQPNFSPINVQYMVSTRKLICQEKRKERKRIKNLKKAVKAARRKLVVAKQGAAVNSSVLSNTNSENGNAHTNQQINFPRTPKPNPGPSQCVDEMPVIKNTRKKKNKKKRNALQKKIEERKGMKVLRNCS